VPWRRLLYPRRAGRVNAVGGAVPRRRAVAEGFPGRRIGQDACNARQCRGACAPPAGQAPAEEHREHRPRDAPNAGRSAPGRGGDQRRGDQLRDAGARQQAGYRQQVDAGRSAEDRLGGDRDADPVAGFGADVVARLQELLVLATPRAAAAGGRSAAAGGGAAQANEGGRPPVLDDRAGLDELHSPPLRPPPAVRRGAV
jgi:hypothetical protein